MDRQLLRFFAALAIAATPAVGCNGGIDLFDPPGCSDTTNIQCFDNCSGANIGAICNESGQWECPPQPDVECWDECPDAGFVDCVDKCGEFVVGECIDGDYICPPLDPNQVCGNAGVAADWNAYYGTNGYQGGRAVAMDHLGNVIVTGHFQQTLESQDGGPIDPNGGYDTFIAKHDALGARQWLAVYGQPGDERPSGLGVDAAGNIYLAMGVTATPSQPANMGPLTLVKLSPNGIQQWERTYPNIYTGSDLPMLAVSDDGSMTIVGTYTGASIFGTTVLPTFGETDIFVARLNADGDPLWSKSFGGASFDYVQSVDIDASGRVLIAGSYSAPIAFDQTALAHAGGFDGFVASLDAAGNVLWAKSVGSAGGDLCARVAAGPSGDVAVTGHFESAIMIDGTVFNPDEIDGGAFVWRLDAAGENTVQLTQLPGSGAGELMSQRQYSVAIDDAGGMVVGGQFAGFSQLVVPSDAESDHDMLLLYFDASAAQQWGYSFGGYSAEYVSDVATGPNGQIAVVGEYWSDINLGLAPLPSFIEGAVFLAQFSTSALGSD